VFQADRVDIDVVVENQIDILLPDLETANHCVTRSGLVDHFDPKKTEIQAEMGLSLFITVTTGRHQVKLLFDVGLTGQVLLHNMKALGLDLEDVDHVVISHGHPDHYGGIESVLAERTASLPISTHADAFLPRYALMGDGRNALFYNQALREDRLDRGPGRLLLSRDPVELGWGTLTTGEIPRVVDFEAPVRSGDTRAPGLYQVNAQGEWGYDDVWDEQALVIDVKNEGLIVITGCAHAGVVNTIKRAQQLVGGRPIRAVIGGFHLGFPTTPKENVEKTLSSLVDTDVRSIMPMHCSGLAAHAAFSAALPDNYIQPAAGTHLVFGS